MADAAPSLAAPVLVQLDRARPLVLDFRALRKAELRFRELTGQRDLVIFELIDRIGASLRVGLTELSVFLWAALSVDDASITEDTILVELSPPGRMRAAVQALVAAMNVQFDDGSPKTGKEDGAGDASRDPFPPGTSSGPPAASTSASPTPSSGG